MSDRIEDGGAELLPCPFCGCTGASRNDDGGFTQFECDWCHATSGYDPEADLEAPEYHWNRRCDADLIPDLVSALERAEHLVRLLTVRQVLIEGTSHAIIASGLNPWAINEGLATGDERVDAHFIGAAIAPARQIGAQTGGGRS